MVTPAEKSTEMVVGDSGLASTPAGRLATSRVTSYAPSFGTFRDAFPEASVVASAVKEAPTARMRTP